MLHQNELGILKQLDHPNILRLLGTGFITPAVLIADAVVTPLHQPAYVLAESLVPSTAAHQGQPCVTDPSLAPLPLLSDPPADVAAALTVLGRRYLVLELCQGSLADLLQQRYIIS